MVLTMICLCFCYTLQSTAPIPTTFIAIILDISSSVNTEVQVLNIADVLFEKAEYLYLCNTEEECFLLHLRVVSTHEID